MPLSKVEKACQGNTLAQRRDAAIFAVFRATGIRLAELAGIRYHPDDPDRSDVDLQRCEIYIRGKSGKDRIVRIDHEAARRSTGISGSGPGIRRRTARDCGSGPVAAGR